MHRSPKKILLLSLPVVAFVIAVSLLVYLTDLHVILFDRARLLAFIEQYRTHAAVIFISLQAFQVVAAPIPGEFTGFVGGVLFGTAWGVVYSTIGLTLGSLAAFLLARLMGRPLVEAVVSPETVARFDYVMKHKGMFLAFLLFLIPGFPKDYLCYLLGLGHMRVVEFLAISVSGRLLGTVMLTLGGSYFRDERWHALFVLTGFAVLIILLTMIYRQHIERLFKRWHAWQRFKENLARRQARDAAQANADKKSNHRPGQ